MSEFLDKFNEAKALSKFTKGTHVMLPRTGTQYVIANVRANEGTAPIATIKRAFPKLSKAEKKRARKARRGRPGGLL